MIKDEKLDQALIELEIKHKNDSTDRAQLNHIIFQILGYPDVEEAEKHHRANIMGTNDLIEKQRQLEIQIREKGVNNLEVCPCCGALEQNQELRYWTSFDDLKMGVGVHLYFRNLSYNALVFMLMFLLYSIYALVTNVQAYKTQTSSLSNLMCLLEDGGCGLADIGAGSKVLREQPISSIKNTAIVQCILGIIFVVIWSFMNVLKIHLQRIFIIEMESIRLSASDFTLMIEEFPKSYLSKSYEENLKNIQEMFKEYGKDMESELNYEVIKINVARPLYNESKENQIKKQEIKEQLEGRQQIFRSWLQFRKENDEFPIRQETRAIEYKNYSNFFMEKYDVPTFHDHQLEEKNVVFVTMRSSKARQQIQKFNPKPSWKNIWNIFSENSFPIEDVIISRAPQPEEIKWQNIGFSKKAKNFRKLMIFGITLLLVGASLGISIGIASININNVVENRALHQYVPIVMSLVVTLSNVGIQMSIIYLSYLQKQFINSAEQSSIALKIGIAQLLNSIGVPLIVAFINVEYQTEKFYAAGGLVEDVFWISVFGLISPIARLCDPYHIFLQMQRRYIEEPQERIKLYGQKSLNDYYGNYEMDIGYEYAYIIKTSIFTAFFTPLQPVIAIFAPAGLIIFYFVNKRNLFLHFKRPCYHQANISGVVDMILLLSPIAFGFGHLTIMNFIPDNNENIEQLQQTLVINWINVIIGFAFFFLVPLKIFYCCMTEPQYDHWDYQAKRAFLQTDYDRLNPITKTTAIHEFYEFLSKLQENEELPDQAEMIKFTVSNIKSQIKYETEKKNSAPAKFPNSQYMPHSQNLDNFKKFLHINQTSSNDLNE